MEPLSYPLNEIALVTKRHIHDVRNALTGMEFELTSLGAGATEPATRESVERLRDAAAEIGRLLQGLSSKYSTETAAILPVVQIAERWRTDARHVATNADVEWNILSVDQMICVEAGLVRSLLKDILELAVRISGKAPLRVNCHCQEERVVFEIAAGEGNQNISIAGFHQDYWAVLQRLAERNRGLIYPAKLGSADNFPMRLSFPLHPTV